MTTPERVCSLIDSVAYVVKHNIPGSIVECGVWRGGSMMAVALTLLEHGRNDIDLYLFDTFSGMVAPSSNDGDIANSKWQSKKQRGEPWCAEVESNVRSNLMSTGYPPDKIHFVAGRVEETLPHHGLDSISLLRLDTDWYDSTKHELNHLFPALSPCGVLIVDDYGRWEGCRKAVDEYFSHTEYPILFTRIDPSARIAVKQGAVNS